MISFAVMAVFVATAVIDRLLGRLYAWHWPQLTRLAIAARHEYPASEPDTIDTDEVITAVAKMVAKLTCSQSGTIRPQVIKKLMREIMEYDAEFRQEDTVGATGSAARR